MNIQSILESIKAETTRFYSLKTKAAKAKSRSKIIALRLKASEILDVQAASVNGLIVKGTVILADGRDGDLWIDTEAYGRVIGNVTSSVDSKSWYASTCCVSFERGQVVEFELEAHVDFDRSGIHLTAKAIKGGKFDAKKYAELCQKGNLAFFKYPDGHMSGLFA
jgi:hypothetical protein